MNFHRRPSSVLTAVLLASIPCCAALAARPNSDTSKSASTAVPPPLSQSTDVIVIPGPLRSFLRMAGISQEVTPADVLPLLARNAFLYGHQGGRRTEYLVLADRYVQLARELQTLASPDGMIHVAGCDDAGKLIQILGYKFENGCSSKDASLVTSNAERAFLTSDSGFPLTQLEESLQKGTPFATPFPATRVPVIFSNQEWTSLLPAKQRGGATLLDMLMNDENVDRLYTAMSKIDPETRTILLRSPGLRRLYAYGPVLDFYGSRLCIRAGSVVVPAGDAGERSWQELVGASPKSPGDFVLRLLNKDQGWLAAYFDALSRVSASQQAHIAQGDRLKNLYTAYRLSDPGVGAATSVFPRNSGLQLLFTRLQWDAQGQPEVPGSLSVWRELFARDDKSDHLHAWTKPYRDVSSPERLLEAVVAYSNLPITGPAQTYLTLSSIDEARAPEKHLSEATARLLANKYSQYNGWYSIFVEFPALDDASITQFLVTADRVNALSNPNFRSNVMGAFQAEVGIWQILARQKQIPTQSLNPSWQSALQSYATVTNSTQLFDVARKSLQTVVVAAGGKQEFTQDQLVELLAGPSPASPDAARVREEIARKIHAVLDDQRLASLDTLFVLYDGLGQMAHGEAIGDSLLPLAGALREFELPQPIFSAGERVTWSPVVYVSRHAELQVRTDLTKVIRGPSTPTQLENARSWLAPFLRDTLVGLNYAYYEPPGAQVLHSNPLFVRSHDFSGSSIQGIRDVWGSPTLVGIGATAGGGAYLIGSLADLPYVLALTEEDFIAPQKIQALTWRETVPELLVDAILPRWWDVSKDELHSVSLYQRAGEELLAAAPANAELRDEVATILADRMDSGHVQELKQALKDPQGAAAAKTQMLPADTFYLAAEFRRRFPDQAAQCGPASKELDDLARKNPAETTPQRLSIDFGVPHPTLAETASPELLTTEPFPVSGGATSRLFSESWESNNLYWARLADEMGYAPSMLNVLIPELTRQMVANISATSIDDWPALLRAMDETGEEFRQGRIGVRTASTTVNNQEFANGGTHVSN